MDRQDFIKKLALVARLRRETILTVGWVARRLERGTRKSAVRKLHRWMSQEQGQRKGQAKNYGLTRASELV